MKRVVITGGLGFIGSNVAAGFASRGDTVVLLDACLDPYGWNFANVKDVRHEFVKGDVRDLDLVRRTLTGADVVVDCASQISHQLSVSHPFLDIDINCRGALTVLEAARAVCPQAKLIYASTRGVVGKMVRTPIDEEHPTDPTDMNGIDKLAAEKYYRLYGRLYGLRTTALRINNTYGERGQMKHDDYGVINWFIRCALRNEPITIHGEGHQTRDYNYVGDVVDAFLRAADSDAADREVFWLGSGTQTRLIDMIDRILKMSGSRSTLTKIPRPADRERIEIGNFQVTIEKIRAKLGWSPKVSIDEGLRRTIDYYRTRLPEYL